jgi:hypothetical protein
MLFDVHQVQQSREEFDALSLSVFGEVRAIAAGVDGERRPADGRAPGTGKERKDFFAFRGGKELAAEIEKFRAFAEAQGSVRLDVGKLTAISAAEASALADALQKLRKKAMPMWFNNPRSSRECCAPLQREAVGDQQGVLKLLFEMMIIEGKSAEFEELGLEFAVAYEMSPPIWEVYVNTVSAAVKSSVAKAVAAANPRENGFPLKGVISVASANQIAELNAHAASRSEVTLDMARSRASTSTTRAIPRSGEELPARGQARDPRQPERAQRRAPRGDRREPLRHPGAPQVQLKSRARRGDFPATARARVI